MQSAHLVLVHAFGFFETRLGYDLEIAPWLKLFPTLYPKSVAALLQKNCVTLREGISMHSLLVYGLVFIMPMHLMLVTRPGSLFGGQSWRDLYFFLGGNDPGNRRTFFFRILFLLKSCVWQENWCLHCLSVQEASQIPWWPTDTWVSPIYVHAHALSNQKSQHLLWSTGRGPQASLLII